MTERTLMKKTIPPLLFSISTVVLCTSVNADTTLRMAHLWPASSTVNQEIYQAWAQKVEQESDGQLRVEIYPSQTLSKADHAYEAAVNGIADIAITVQGYTSGRFPLSEIVQLPGVSTSASQGACILQTLYDEGDIAKEYEDAHTLFLFTTGPAYLHTQDSEIKTPADLEGLRMRHPSEVAGEMLTSMGAHPVGIPAPDIYTSLQRGVIDGLSFPWEAMTVFRINELVNHHLELPYYTGTFVATMNQASYDRLTPELKAVIDNNSGMTWASKAGQVFDDIDKTGREEAMAQGDTIYTVEDPLNDPAWAPPLEQGTENYLEQLEQRGLDSARSVYEKALTLRDQCEE